MPPQQSLVGKSVTERPWNRLKPGNESQVASKSPSLVTVVAPGEVDLPCSRVELFGKGEPVPGRELKQKDDSQSSKHNVSTQDTTKEFSHSNSGIHSPAPPSLHLHGSPHRPRHQRQP